MRGVINNNNYISPDYLSFIKKLFIPQDPHDRSDKSISDIYFKSYRNLWMGFWGIFFFE